MNIVQELVVMDLPVVGTRRKPDVSYECEATDRIVMSSERPKRLVSLPEFDCFVRGALNANISGVRMGEG